MRSKVRKGGKAKQSAAKNEKMDWIGKSRAQNTLKTRLEVDSVE